MAKQQERVGSLRLRNVLSDAHQLEVDVLHSWVVVLSKFFWANRLNKSTDTCNTVLVALRQIKKGEASLPDPVVKRHSKTSLLKLRGN